MKSDDDEYRRTAQGRENNLSGIGDVNGAKLSAAGFEYSYQVLGQFLLLGQDEEMFIDWLQDVCGNSLNNTVPFWSMELHCTPQHRAVHLHARKLVHSVMLVGEAMCRGFESDVSGGSGGRGGGAKGIGDGDGGSADVVLATFAQRAEPLPQELWLHILTFLRVSELGRGMAVLPGTTTLRHCQAVKCYEAMDSWCRHNL